MSELIHKISNAPPNIQLYWVIWLILITGLLIITLKIGIKNYKLWRNLRKVSD